MTRRPSPTFLVACLALVVALCGATTAGYAAGKASGNSLIRKQSLSGNRLKADTVTGAQVKESTLGTVPSASSAGHAATAAHAVTADHASTADAVPPSAFHALVPRSGWTAGPTSSSLLGWRQDASGFVHLQGLVQQTGPDDTIVVLPASLRPSSTTCMPALDFGATGSVCILPNGEVDRDTGNASILWLDGLTYHPA